MYPLQIKNYNEINKIKLINKLKQKDILTQIHYLPLNNHPLYKSKDSNFPGSKKYFKKSFSIPLHEDITVKDAKKIANDLKRIEQKFFGIKIGSYPYFNPKSFGTSIVIRSKNQKNIILASKELLSIIKKLGGEFEIKD